MKLYFIFSLLLLFSFSAAGQIKVQTFYDRERILPKEVYYVADSLSQTITGTYVSYYFNGNVKSMGQFEKNRAIGIWKHYYENGKVKMEGTMEDNFPNGYWKYYYENGRISMEGYMSKDHKEKEWIFYYENGNLKSRGSFKNDEKEGLWNYFYEDGGLKAEASYSKGKGAYKEYYPTGNLKMEGLNNKGENDSLWVYYYETGVRKAEGFFENGLKKGSWKYYYPNHNLSAEGVYEGDQKSGKWVYYHENGLVSSEGVERGGLKDGYWKLYHKDGSFKAESIYENGSGEYIEYYAKGKVKVKGYIENGHNGGLWKYYYEDGSLEGEAVFIDGEGDFTGYYKDGSIKMKGKIKDGKNVDIWELYEKDGSLVGYYKPYYEDDKPVYKIVTAVAADADSVSDYLKPEYRFKNRRIVYFVPKVNEFRGFIFSTNPLGVTVGRIPVAVEYYLQDRLGHELHYVWIRDPFFTSNQKMPEGDVYDRGFSVSFRQKFYHPGENFGMFYFGHEVRYTSLTHYSNLSSPDSAGIYHPAARLDEQRIEYSLLLGNRWMKFFDEKWVNDEHKSGITIDLHGGIGVGYRFFKQDPYIKETSHIFEGVSMKRGTIPVRFGVTVGYVF